MKKWVRCVSGGTTGTSIPIQALLRLDAAYLPRSAKKRSVQGAMAVDYLTF